eukprot:7302751-Alexandrium_andersonii.AAC.1
MWPIDKHNGKKRTAGKRPICGIDPVAKAFSKAQLKHADTSTPHAFAYGCEKGRRREEPISIVDMIRF